MPTISRRLSSLAYLTRPLALAFVGVLLIALGIAYLLLWLYDTGTAPSLLSLLTLQFLPPLLRGILPMGAGAIVLGLGIWYLSSVTVVPLPNATAGTDEVVISSRRDTRPLKVVVMSGGAGILVLSELSESVQRMTCITPVQDPVEYYYRASNLGQLPNIYYVVPTPEPFKVYAELDDGTLINVMHVDHHTELAPRHVARLMVLPNATTERLTATNDTAQLQQEVATTPLPQVVREAITSADAIILGPGSLFESVLPNFLLNELRETVQQSRARTIYVCNLMTEPGLTTGFGVGDHIRQIKRYAGFAPDFVLINAQRIDSDIRDIYAAAHQAPVYLNPEEYEETAVPASDQMVTKQVMVEGSVIIETDLASSVIQSRASITKPGETRAVRVLRHDPEKLRQAILEVLRRM